LDGGSESDAATVEPATHPPKISRGDWEHSWNPSAATETGSGELHEQSTIKVLSEGLILLQTVGKQGVRSFILGQITHVDRTKKAGGGANSRKVGSGTSIRDTLTK